MDVIIQHNPLPKVEEILALQIRMSESVRHAVKEVESFKHECLELDRKVDTLASLLKQAARFSITNPAGLYESPTRQIAMEVEKTLERALGLVKKCRRSGMLKRVITITNVSDFRKVNLYLDNSIANVQYLLNISASGEDRPIHMGLPPIASNEPVLSIVWDNVSIVHVGNAEEKTQGASYLAELAKDSRNASIICEQGGVPPLLRLLREGTPAGQEEAARALGYLAADRRRVLRMRKEGAITFFLEILVHGPMKVQAMVCWAISQFCANDLEAQVEIASAGGIRLLVFLLGHDNVDDLSKTTKAMNIHTVVKTTMTNQKNASGSCREQPDQEGEPGPDSDFESYSNSLSRITPKPNAIHNNSRNISAKSTSLENGKSSLQSSSLRITSQNSRDNEDPETKAKLKAEAARALWKLAQNNIQNSKSITDTRALLCFARLIQFDENDVQYNCVMAVMEIAGAAEHDAELRRAAFKTNSPAAKAVLDQLLRVIENGHPELQVPCLTAMGSLARIFPAAARVIPPITEALASQDVAVAAEASHTLYKFANKENYLHVDHSRTILESNGALYLVALLHYLDMFTQTSALNLLCCLSINVPESNLLAQAGVLKALESMTRTAVLSQNIELKNNVMDAIAKLELYQSGSHGNSSTKGTYVP
ncbi:unnamed protein product [Sphagnum troendelagicum]|uniref:DUF7792 domain-containing protein n=1 Tax=Sphagnum troendelagicum TaxID=128251 RepID=A0ABP0V5C5_9BRYO